VRSFCYVSIKPDSTNIESMLREHHSLEKTKTSQLNESIQNIGQRVSRLSLVPKVKLWLHYPIWLVSLIIIGYLSFRISRIDDIREKAFAEGEQYTISSLRGYFDRNPEHYKSYRKWTEEKDSVPNQK